MQRPTPQALDAAQALEQGSLRFSGVLTALIGSIALCGWVFEGGFLQSLVPGLLPMRPLVALGFVLSGAALFLVGRPWVLAERLARALALGMAALALLTLAERLTGWNPGLDSLLFRGSIAKLGEPFPGRIPANTAVCFLFTAICILLLGARPAMPRRPLLLALLSSWIVAFGLMVSTGYLANWFAGFRWWDQQGMAVHVALMFFFLGVILLRVACREAGLRWVVGRWLAACFVCGLGLLSAVATNSFRSAAELLDSVRLIKHTHEVVEKIASLNSDLDEIQVAARGFLITRDETFLASQEAAYLRLAAGINTLRKLTRDNPGQVRRIDGIQSLVREWLDFQDQTIVARRERGFAPAEALVASGKGRDLRENIRALVGEMREEEYGLLEVREARSEMVVRKTFSVLPLGTLISLALFSVGIYLLNREFIRRQKSASALLESEMRFRSLVKATSQIVWTSSARGDTILPLPNSGGAPADVERFAPGPANAIHPEDAPGALAQWKRALAASSLFEAEYRVGAANGYRDFAVRGVPVRTADGALSEWVGACTDITERKQAERELQRLSVELEQILNSAGEAIVRLNMEARVEYANPAAEALFGWSAEELREGFFYEKINPPERANKSWAKGNCPVGMALHEGIQKRGGEVILRARNGSALSLEFTSTPIRENGQLHGAVVLFHDIEEKKRAEAEILRLNEGLEQRVAERTAQLEGAVKELESFSYSVSHDLRSPLRAIDGYSRILLEDHAAALGEEGARVLNVVRSETQRMGQLIDDLLEFSRLGRQSMQAPREVDMEELARTVFRDLVAMEKGREVEWILGSLPAVRGEKSMLRQVWVNLLANALKFTRHAAQPRIEVGFRREETEEVFFVRDNGAGFDMRFAGKLFGVFQRLHSGAQFEGTGVGLAIVQRVIGRHGGRVWAEGAVDAGATVSFAFPLNTL